MAVRVVEVPRATSQWPAWPSLTDPESFEEAALDVDSCIGLLEALTHRARHDRLDRRVRAAAYPFLKALLYGDTAAGSTAGSATTPASPPAAEPAVDETLMRLFGPEKYWALVGGSAPDQT
ncbi:hypothetical protein [Mycobacteroides abscessus]|nr:hypothetical protein [Mycobacteroides abscessus]